MPFNDMNKFESSFKNLAKLLDEEDRADEFLNWRHGYLSQIQEKTNKIGSKLLVYNEYSDKAWTTGAQTSGIDDIITLAGGKNIAGDLPTLYYTEVDPEWVVKENPAIIIIPDYAESLPAELTGYSVNSEKTAKAFIETVRNRTILKNTDAIKNGMIFVLDGHVGWAGSHGIIGVCYCAKWFYPGIFKDLDPEVIHKEYFEKWLGVPYKGVWAYPQAS